MITLLVLLAAMALGILVGYAGAGLLAREKVEIVESQLDGREAHLSSCCNWAALNTSRNHPEVEIVCKAIESAFLDGHLPNADKLDRDLRALKQRSAS